MRSTAPDLRLSSDEAVRIATDAYIYGFPLVLMSVTRDVMTAVPSPDGRRAPVNQFLHIRSFPDPTFTDVISPNTDTLHSNAWLDLAKEPMVLSIPAMDRYYVMQLLDAWTNVFAAPGTRTTGNGKGDFAIIGPAWRGLLPDGLRALHSPTRLASLVGRTQTNGKNDYAAVNAIQNQYKLTPLSAWNKPNTPSKSAPINSGIDLKTPPLDQVVNMDANAFFSRMNTLMKDNPPAVIDSLALERFTRIGINSGRPFELNGLEPAVADGVRKGVEAARPRIVSESRKPRGKCVNGWQTLPNYLVRFGSDYNFRAVSALMGLGANIPEDAIYPVTRIDTAGQPLNGKNTYVIRFARRQLPPVNAFWSIAAYNSRQRFIPNRIHRYAIGDRDELKFETDDSLTIYLSNVSPAPECESNWLPVGADSFNLMMRLYWPKPEAVNGTWMPPGIERL